jgi:hypothetical protein
MKNLRLLLLFPFSFAVCMLLPSTAFGQVVVTPPAPLTAATISAATIIITALAIVVGYTTQAINSGSFFGIVTIPKPLLPYLGLVAGFLGPFTASITVAPVKDEAGWLNALFAGLIGLGGLAIGVTAKQHIDAAKRDRTPIAPPASGGSGLLPVDAVNKAANEITPPQSTTRTSARLALPQWITRMRTSVALLVPFTGAGLACANGTPTPQTQVVIDDSAALALCVEGVIQKDESAVPPVQTAQVIVDEGVTCAPEAAALVAAIGQEVNASSTAAVIAKVHADVSAKHAAKVTK